MPIKISQSAPRIRSGPIVSLFCILFTNELPEMIHDTAINQLDPDPDVKQGWPAYQVCYYADDTTLQYLTLILLDSQPS